MNTVQLTTSDITNGFVLILAALSCIGLIALIWVRFRRHDRSLKGRTMTALLCAVVIILGIAYEYLPVRSASDINVANVNSSYDVIHIYGDSQQDPNSVYKATPINDNESAGFSSLIERARTGTGVFTVSSYNGGDNIMETLWIRAVIDARHRLRLYVCTADDVRTCRIIKTR